MRRSVCCQEVGEGRDDGLHSALQDLNTQVFECQRLDVDLQFLSEFVVHIVHTLVSDGFNRFQQLSKEFKGAPKIQMSNCASKYNLKVLAISYSNSKDLRQQRFIGILGFL